MSFDYHIYNISKSLINEKELREKLGDDEVKVFDISLNEKGEVKAFQIKFDNYPHSIWFVAQEDSTYWTYTYDLGKQSYEVFMDILDKVAGKLGFLIYDSQLDEVSEPSTPPTIYFKKNDNTLNALAIALSATQEENK